MIPNHEFSADLEKRIQKAYEKSGNYYGRALLYSHRWVFDEARVAFIGMNPGGTKPHPHVLSFRVTRYACTKALVSAGGVIP